MLFILHLGWLLRVPTEGKPSQLGSLNVLSKKASNPASMPSG